MAGQGFGVPDVDQAQDQLQGVDEPGARLDAPLDAEAQDARGLAGAVLFAVVPVGAVLQSRVVLV